MTLEILWEFQGTLAVPHTPQEIRPYHGVIDHHCPLNNPWMKPYFFGGGMGLLTSNHLGFTDLGDFKPLPKKCIKKDRLPKVLMGETIQQRNHQSYEIFHKPTEISSDWRVGKRKKWMLFSHIGWPWPNWLESKMVNEIPVQCIF